MRVAVVLLGHFRSFECTRQSWIVALDGLEVDFYLYTWDTIDSCTRSWHKDENAHSPRLTCIQIQLLREWDNTATVDTQIWSEENSTYPYPRIMEYWNRALVNCIQRIRRSHRSYTTIICGRFDIDVSTIRFKDIGSTKGTICLGYHPSMFVPRGIHVCDILYTIHPDDIDQLELVCVDIMAHRYNKPQRPEHRFYDVVCDHFSVVDHKWNDFRIIRMDGTIVGGSRFNIIFYCCCAVVLIIVIIMMLIIFYYKRVKQN